MVVWGIHMGRHVATKPVEEGYIAIGWVKVGDLSLVAADRGAYKNKLAEVFPKDKHSAFPNWAGALYKFVHEMKIGDVVVYPSKVDRMVNIGRISGEYEYREGDSDNYPNCRKVKWLKSVARDEFSQAALNEIGSALTLFKVRNHYAEFLKCINEKVDSAAELEEGEGDEAAASSASRQAQESANDYIIRKLKNELSPFEFEEFSAHILECLGYTARVTEKTGDGGVDVIAHKDALGFEPPIIKVQCKQITSQSGEPEVNKLLGTLGEGEYGLFVNLGSYTKQARNLERNRAKVRLIDGEQLVELVLDNYEKLSPLYRGLIPMKQIYVPDL